MLVKVKGKVITVKNKIPFIGREEISSIGKNGPACDKIVSIFR